MDIARRFISKTIEGSKETIVNEIIEFDFDKAMKQTVCDLFEDWEYAQGHGVFYNQQEDLFSIDVDDCLEELKERQYNEDEEYAQEKLLMNYLDKYSGYTIYII